jgi:HEAT repeat protein
MKESEESGDESLRASATRILADATAARADDLPAYKDIVDDSRDVILRSELCWAAGVLRDSAAAPFLQQALGNASPLIRRESVRALGQLKDDASAEAIGKLIKADEEPDVCVAAVEALALISNPVSLPVFDANLRDGTLSDHVLGALAEYSSIIVGGECLLDALHILTSSQSAEVRFWTCYSLGDLGTTSSFGVLEPLLFDERVGWRGKTVSSEASDAIARIAKRYGRPGNRTIASTDL